MLKLLTIAKLGGSAFEQSNTIKLHKNMFYTNYESNESALRIP